MAGFIIVDSEARRVVFSRGQVLNLSYHFP